MYIITFCLLCTFLNEIYAVNRNFYLQVEDVIWDYAPNGNQIYAGDPKDTEVYLKHDKNIPLPGTKYWKSRYIRYTDDTYTERIEDPQWQGLMGPLIAGETGDTMIIHLKNNASFPFTIHTHGYFYHKDDEGATYLSDKPGKDTLDDAIPPGENYTYVWSVLPSYGPTDSDPPCLAYLYHSHNIGQIEVMMGVLGLCLFCKRNTLDENGHPKVARYFPLLFSIMDENFSLYRARSAELAGVDEETISKNFDTWKRANQKYSINGYIYGNLPGLEVCEGDRVDLYIANVGTDFDLHTVYIQGQTMEVFRQKVSTIGVFPGSSLTATIESAVAGKWLLSCQSRDSIKAGMQAIFNVKKCGNQTKPVEPVVQLRGKTRDYFITAEEEDWSYAPTGVDQITGKSLALMQPIVYGKPSESECGFNGTYKKALYKGYTNKYFTNEVKRRGSARHLGFLGPIIAAEVGDTVNVHFWNRASKPYSIQINRFRGTENEQGIQYKDGPEVAVAPNETRSYTWTVPESVGPSPTDPDCLFGRYYSSVDQVKDTFTGLYGPVLTCKKGALNRKSKPVYDKMFFLSFSNMDETESHYFAENVRRACGPNADANELTKNVTFVNANIISSINGFSYANMPGLRMTEGETVAWFIMSVGNGKSDLHSPYFHGNVFEVNGVYSDTFPLIPDVYKTLKMNPDNPGKWLIEDQVQIVTNKYGLSAYYTVIKNHNLIKSPFSARGIIRTYFIGVVEEEWDYAPNLSFTPVPGEPMSYGPNETSADFFGKITNFFYTSTDHHIGHKYIKALYREFTDDSFTEQAEILEDTKHLGTLGPYIKAEVNDTIRVVFKNFARYNYSIQPHGVFYNQTTEGQFYNRGKNSVPQPGDSVAPGETHVYEWPVPPRSGPTKDDFNCAFWYYKSAVDENADAQAGLLGPMVICNPGVLNATGHRTDVNREYTVCFNVFNENASPYLRENIEKYAGKPNETFALMKTEDFFDSNIKMTVNGFLFGTLPGVNMYLGELTTFYTFTWGNPTETHTIHLHGNTFIRKEQGDHRHDTMNAVPNEATQFMVIGVNEGTWYMHCHVENHSLGGMYALYHVIDPDKIYHP